METTNKNKINIKKVDYSGECAITGYRTNTKASTQYGEIFVCTHFERCTPDAIWNKIISIDLKNPKYKKQFERFVDISFDLIPKNKK